MEAAHLLEGLKKLKQKFNRATYSSNPEKCGCADQIRSPSISKV
jgi:hypothetical protein